MSQRARVLWVISLAILPLVALSGFTIWQQYLRDQFVVSTERTYFAQATAYAAEAYLDGNVAAVRALAKHPLLVRPRQGEELDAFLKAVAADNPDWQGIGVVGPDGNAVAGSFGGMQIKPGERPAVSPALIDRRTGKPTVVITVPLEAGESRRSALVVPLPTERFASALMGKIGSPLVDLTVVDAQGQAFIHSDSATLRSLARLQGPAVDAVLAGKAGSDIAPFGASKSLFAYAPVSNYGWGVLLTEPTVTAFAPARRQVLERGAVLAVILAVVGALGWTLAGRLAMAFQSAVQARAEAERLSQDLKRALHARDEFLAAASHDLRNPLSTIEAAAEVLERATGAGSLPQERLAMCASHILSASRRMATLLDAFLDVSRLEAAGELIAEADPSRLQRVVGNLVGNAIRYSPDGGEINVKLDAHDANAVLTVRDRGIGIPSQDQQRVFERFQRGSNVEGRIPGTGIGLAGARQIIEQHGGAITVKSQIGKGSTFTVRFPA